MPAPRLFVILVVAVAAAAAASAQGTAPGAASRTYQSCMVEARQAPGAGLATAKAWQARGGGAPARHCAAVAMIGLGRYADAAGELQKLADDRKDRRAPTLRVDLLGQAANAWLIAGQPDMARRALDRALALRPDDVDLLIDRGVVLTSLKKYWDALGDLNRALVLAPRRPQALVFRAAAHRAVDALEPAENDINEALRLTPQNPDALLELGLILNRKGDKKGARAAWRELLDVAPNAPTAKIARRYLTEIDVK